MWPLVYRNKTTNWRLEVSYFNARKILARNHNSRMSLFGKINQYASLSIISKTINCVMHILYLCSFSHTHQAYLSGKEVDALKDGLIFKAS